MKKKAMKLSTTETPTCPEVALELLNPRGDIAPPPNLGITTRLETLSGKTIGVYWIGKEGGNNFWDVVASALKERFARVAINRYKGPFDLGDTMAARLAQECDAFLYGVGD